jgi:hypothetical protein
VRALTFALESITLVNVAIGCVLLEATRRRLVRRRCAGRVRSGRNPQRSGKHMRFFTGKDLFDAFTGIDHALRGLECLTRGHRVKRAWVPSWLWRLVSESPPANRRGELIDAAMNAAPAGGFVEFEIEEARAAADRTGELFECPFHGSVGCGCGRRS